MPARLGRVAAVVAVVAGVSGPVAASAAQMDANAFLNSYDTASERDQSFMRALLGNLAASLTFGVYQTASTRGVDPIYCPPGDLNDAAIIEMLRAGIEAVPEIGTKPYSQALLRVALGVYPCD